MRLVEPKITLSATDLASFLGCRHRTGLDLAVALGALPKPHWNDPMVQALRARGEEHERRFVESLRNQGLDILDLRDVDDAPSRTLEALESGVDVVVQAELRSDGWHGYADILRRVERPSALGGWSYEVYDTKLARDTRGGTVLQLCVYSDLLAGIQGLTPQRFHVVTPPDQTVHTYRVEDYAAYYRLMRQKLIDTLALGSEVICERHYPEPVAHCEICRWWQRCDARRRQDDHPAFVAGMSRSIARSLRCTGTTRWKRPRGCRCRSPSSLHAARKRRTRNSASRRGCRRSSAPPVSLDSSSCR